MGIAKSLYAAAADVIDVNERLEGGKTLLHEVSDNAECVGYLLEKGRFQTIVADPT